MAYARPQYKEQFENFIGGEWLAPKSGEYFDKVSPVDGKILTRIPRSNEADVDAAVAAGVKAYITHPVLSGPAIERLNKSEIDELVVTNSIPLSQDGEKCSKIRVISLGATIAECIKRLSNEESLSEMFI